ncbi:Carboxylesterase [Exophiala viscosa]|uniref:Carboxylesterase n=1 Tax=Exophiala viscosa TaxID=2486360 RepID=UPI0021951D38|nr:Carboxylesterase [Exophiala viscosa]
MSHSVWIPYAQSPTQNLQSAPPVAYNSTAMFYVTKFSHACPVVQQTPLPAGSARKTSNVNLTAPGQYVAAANGEIGITVGEDCLSVNGWTKPQNSSSLKPVMVWVYGAAFTSGNSNNPLYNGQYLADREDVVVVNFKYFGNSHGIRSAPAKSKRSYRTNIFGFPGIPAGTESQNVGLLHQRLATE